MRGAATTSATRLATIHISLSLIHISYGSALAAYVGALRTGRGESFDLAQYEAAVRCQAGLFCKWFDKQVQEERGAGAPRDNISAGAGYYECADGEGVYLFTAGQSTTRKAVEFFGLEYGSDLFPEGIPSVGIESVSYTHLDVYKRQILGYALEGKKPFTLGFTEPQAGSDSAAMATTATKRDGKVYINGNKTFNTSADRAPYMLCVCRSGVNESPYKDFSMYLFPMDRPGVAIEKLDKIGNNMCGTYEVHLDDVECEESDLVGEECKGFYLSLIHIFVGALLDPRVGNG